MIHGCFLIKSCQLVGPNSQVATRHTAQPHGQPAPSLAGACFIDLGDRQGTIAHTDVAVCNLFLFLCTRLALAMVRYSDHVILGRPTQILIFAHPANEFEL